MSCNYAEGLSDYAHKGVVGLAEIFDTEEEINRKVELLVDLFLSSKHIVVHTGAGISTSSGIPDFRGPTGVWTLEKKGIKPTVGIDFGDAKPTKTHMLLKLLVENGYIKYIISQNVDGLHLKSGVNRKFVSEMHGNYFVETCTVCQSIFIRDSPSPTVGKKIIDGSCRRKRKPCRKGKIQDNILDWEHDLPQNDLDMALMHSTIADLNLCLGTSLQIVPSGNLCLKNKKFGGKLVICNLQPTKHCKKADLVINTYVDDIFEKLAKRLGIENIPEYDPIQDPTKNKELNQEWNITPQNLKDIELKYKERTKRSAKPDTGVPAKKSKKEEKTQKEEDKRVADQE